MAKRRELEINGQIVEVTEEVYKAYMQPIWKEEKMIQRAYQSLENAMSKKSKVNLKSYRQIGDTKNGFTFAPLGLPLSLDQIYEDSGFEIEDTHDPFVEASYNILVAELLQVLNTFTKRDAEVMKLLLINGVQREK